MSDRSVELLNELLPIFNRNSGEYLKLVGDETKVTSPPAGLVKINDINTGAISNPLEYSRRLSAHIIDQFNLNTASDSWLDWIGVNLYSIARLTGESDQDYIDRIKATITAIKCTPIGIELGLVGYADEVQVIDGIDGGMFADVSFADNYKDFYLPGEDIIKAAIAGVQGGDLFSFRVILTNPDPIDFAKIIAIVDDYKLAGTFYIIEVI